MHIIRKLIKYSFKMVAVQALFTLTVFEVLLFEGRSVLAPARRGTGSKRVKCGWFYMLWIIARNVLKIENGWTKVEKDATTVVYVGTHFSLQFLENSRSHSNACNTLISLKKHAPIKWERDWWFYGKYVW